VAGSQAGPPPPLELEDASAELEANAPPTPAAEDEVVGLEVAVDDTPPAPPAPAAEQCPATSVCHPARQ